MKEINHTEGNDATLRAVLKRQGELFPVELSEEVMAEVVSRIGKRTTCGCAVSDVGTVLIDISGELPSGGYVIAVYGKLDGMRWRSACRGLHITKVTMPGVGNGIATDSDAYDIEMEVEMYKQPSSEAAIQRHNEDREAHADIRNLIPDNAVTDPFYVHTDNNYSDEDKDKLAGLSNYDDTQVRQMIADTNAHFANYYTKAKSYSSTEVDTLLRTQRQGQYVVAATLPTPSEETRFKIYLVPSQDAEQGNIKDEYVTLQDGGTYAWEKIGSTAVDLSGYSTTDEMNAAIASALTSYYTKTQTDTLLSGKQDTLTFDAVPTQGSTNPVMSGGVYNHIRNLANKIKVRNVDFGVTSEAIIWPNEIVECTYVDSIECEIDEFVAGEKCEYCIKFDVGSTIPTLTLPAYILWAEEITLEANTHYVVLISYENGHYYGDWKSYPLTSE